MNKLGKVLLYSLLTLVVVLAIGITFTIGWRPFLGPRTRPATARKFEITPQRLARGEYLVEHVNGCMVCHSTRDWTKRDSPVLPNGHGSGTHFFVKGMPGDVYAPNITPDATTGLGSWSDDEIARAIREGVGKGGYALFPLMPYMHYRTMSDEDVASVVVYLRSLPPVRHDVPVTALIFPVKYLIRSVPEPITAPVPGPDSATPEKRGAYLVNIGGCIDCHTPQDDHGQPLAGMDFAGGFVLEGDFGRAASANITPDASGISYYDEKQFIQAIRTGYVGARALNQVMPWGAYGGMTDADLSDIFAYLKTLKAVRHHVDNSLPPTYCKLCRQTHGGGDQN